MKEQIQLTIRLTTPSEFREHPTKVRPNGNFAFGFTRYYSLRVDSRLVAIITPLMCWDLRRELRRDCEVRVDPSHIDSPVEIKDLGFSARVGRKSLVQMLLHKDSLVRQIGIILQGRWK